MELEDQPVNVRQEEALPEPLLREYLRSKISTVDGKTPLTIKQYPAGYSNLTYLVEQLGHKWVLRRPPLGANIKSAHDMSREYQVLKFLENRYPLAPKPVLFCQDQDLLGSEFYLMSHCSGIIIRKDLPSGLDLSEEQRANQAFAALDAHIALHQVPCDMWPLKKDSSSNYVQRQLQGWSLRYNKARTEDAPSYEKIMQWLTQNQPEISEDCLIHNDFKLDNLVFSAQDPTSVEAVLDWEMATLGDPLMDLGSSLAYWVEAGDPDYMLAFRTLPSHLPGYPSRAELVNYYAKNRSIELPAMNFYYTFGLFRLAVIAQQIYRRFTEGHTKDKRFAQLIHGVKALEFACQQSIDSQPFS